MAMRAPAQGTVYIEKDILKFGGLNNRDASNTIEDFQASDLMNVTFDNKGEITKRSGYAAFLTAQIDVNPIVSLFSYLKSNGSAYLLATSATSVYNITSGTASAIKTGLTGNGNRFTAATYLDVLYMANGSDGVMKWDGTTFSTVAGLPFSNAKYLCTHKNRMYYTGDPSAPSRVWFSDLGAPETVQALSFVDINTNDGDSITGMAEHLDALVIFKERSIHVIRGTGPQNYIVVDSHQAHGTVSHWSIVQIMNRLFYLSRNGVYSFDGNHIELESDVIRGSVLGLNANTPWNQQYLYKACAVEYDNKYWLSLVEGTFGTTNNRIYVLDYTHKFWTRFDIPASCFALYSVSNTFYLYSGNTTVGKVYKQDTGTSDDGANINAYLRTKDFDFGAPAHFKSFKGLFFYAREAASQYSINITYYEDFSATSKTVALNLGPKDSLWGSMTWGTDAWGSVLRIVSQTTSVSGQCHYLAFEVSDDSTNPWTFLGFAIRFKVKRRLT